MENTNRALVAVSSSILLFGVSVRVLSGLGGPEQSSSASVSLHSRPIVDSDFKIVSEAVQQESSENKPGKNPNSSLVKLNQTGATVSNSDKVEPDSNSSEGNSVASSQSSANSQVGGETGTSASSASTGNAALDASSGSLSDEDQAGLSTMLSTMSSEDKERFKGRLEHNR